ncbi:MAG: hypothetical protein KA419_08305 [Acidobacteria bacterium]|nr:hypothetical protein [Acidobacteriota bacterium]
MGESSRRVFRVIRVTAILLAGALSGAGCGSSEEPEYATAPPSGPKPIILKDVPTPTTTEGTPAGASAPRARSAGGTGRVARGAASQTTAASRPPTTAGSGPALTLDSRDLFGSIQEMADAQPVQSDGTGSGWSKGGSDDSWMQTRKGSGTVASASGSSAAGARSPTSVGRSLATRRRG